MNKKGLIIITMFLMLLLFGFIYVTKAFNEVDVTNNEEVGTLTATVISVSDSSITVQDEENITYTFSVSSTDADVGDNIIITYKGSLDRNKDVQECTIVSYTISDTSSDISDIPSEWLDDGLFSDYYGLAYEKLETLSLAEKIGQLLLVRYPDSDAVEILENYQFGGYIFYEKDFANKTEEEVKTMIASLQEVANIPILTAVDEEGGKVVRVSSNSNLVSSKFKSPQELYALGGFSEIKEDTIQKSKILSNLGLNLNLAPVVDVSTDSTSYMYARTLGQNTAQTAIYAETVISASKGTGVSYTLKHFPGYGNNIDTHTSTSVDTRTYEDILMNDIPPFEAGIDAGAEAVLVSHNIVSSIDSTNPASLSLEIHNLLRDNLNFTGIIITDDLDMGATSSISDAAVQAILAGNDLIIVTDYESTMSSIEAAVSGGTISEDLIDELAFRVIAWKYYKGLLLEN